MNHPDIFENEPIRGLNLAISPPLGAGVRVLWVIRSLDERPITITGFRILRSGGPSRAKALRCLWGDILDVLRSST
jgi:hypothetical protein